MYLKTYGRSVETLLNKHASVNGGSYMLLVELTSVFNLNLLAYTHVQYLGMYKCMLPCKYSTSQKKMHRIYTTGIGKNCSELGSIVSSS